MTNYLQRTGSGDGYNLTTNPVVSLLASYVPPLFESYLVELTPQLVQEAQNDTKAMSDL